MEERIDKFLRPFACEVLKRIERDQQVYIQYKKSDMAFISHIMKLIRKEKRKKYKLIEFVKYGNNLEFPYSGIQEIKKKIQSHKDIESKAELENNVKSKDSSSLLKFGKTKSKKISEDFEIIEVEEEYIKKNILKDLKRKIGPKKKALFLIEEFSQLKSNRAHFVKGLVSNEKYFLITFIDYKNKIDTSDTIEMPKISFDKLLTFKTSEVFSEEEINKVSEYINYRVDYLKEVDIYYKNRDNDSFKEDMKFGNTGSPLYFYAKEIHEKMKTSEFINDINLFREIFIMNNSKYTKIPNGCSEKEMMDKLKKLVDDEEIVVKDGEKLEIKDIGLKNYMLLEDTLDPIVEMYLKKSSNGYQECFSLLEKRREWEKCLTFYIKTEIVRSYNGDKKYDIDKKTINEFNKSFKGICNDSNSIYTAIDLYSKGCYEDALIKLEAIPNTWQKEIQNEIDVLKLLSIIRNNFNTSIDSNISELIAIKNKVDESDVNLSIRIAMKLVGILIDIKGDFTEGTKYYEEVEKKVKESGLCKGP